MLRILGTSHSNTQLQILMFHFKLFEKLPARVRESIYGAFYREPCFRKQAPLTWYGVPTMGGSRTSG